ncbi:glyoxalase [Flavobacterium sufflavum]|uniref:Glyoxalase n=1 Tax=Flavobacterium sufflavum TaxID=1921138 RepID=A0A437KWI2_9FLAO|nr:VOC family protein [Flavobacterium sufflavum]RVT76751.1 glyoxalase [Flavobacterium sufflavum]
MKTNQIWGNLAVKDLERTTKFYTTLGFKPNGNSEELSSFFFGDNNFVIHFFIKEQLEKFMPGIADLSKGNEIIFSLSAKTKEEVDNWAAEVRKAGGTIFLEPTNYEQGYTFGFSDPDGHKFNVLYWPGM